MAISHLAMSVASPLVRARGLYHHYLITLRQQARTQSTLLNEREQSMYVDKATVGRALSSMYGTAGHLLKVWLTLKFMGLTADSAHVAVDTANSTPALKKLFSCGDPEGRFYIPFAHTPRYLTMKHDASRSIIQTTIQRWATSGSVVTCDPTGFLDIMGGDGPSLTVRAGRQYPFGLGIGDSGFALNADARVSIPLTAFSAWYGRYTDIPAGEDPTAYLQQRMLTELNISAEERELVFVDDTFLIGTTTECLTPAELFALCKPFIDGVREPTSEIYQETFLDYSKRIKSMVTGLDKPLWLRAEPTQDVQDLLETGAKAILLYGPPRTGKTRQIDAIVARNSKDRSTIQIHDGWGYDHLVEGLKPDADGHWVWADGPLKSAIVSGRKYIVLEEINRTAISQALGEVFSLIEDDYRGESNGITLRSGQKLWIPEDTVFFMTMNTIDKSTEDVDDALLGRVAAVEFPSRQEDLLAMLIANDVPAPQRQKLTRLLEAILAAYPLGHGYFAGLSGDVEGRTVIRYYKARIRPVLLNFFGELKANELAIIDNLVDEMFAKS
jgi:5-methylcytosine-specific restriction protein B